MRTEELLKQSQGLTEELQKTNEELAKRSELLQQQKAEVERKNQEIELAKAALEERAQQLALASRYKSEFLANMSHELRTPLNSLLILARLLAENREGNLSDKQVEFAKTIYSGGTDLLLLINDILDLSKIESGTMAVAIDEIELSSMLEFCERTFRQVAQANALEFEIIAGDSLPDSIHTDPRRVQQVLKNLLSNAFKFTDIGKVVLEVKRAQSGWNPQNQVLSQADEVIAFSVIDTGIGIPLDKQQIIFEAFQQADGSASRRYGGTGLGLSISREIARLLGADLTVVSTPGRGSIFTLYVPRVYVPVAPTLGAEQLESQPGAAWAEAPAPAAPGPGDGPQVALRAPVVASNLPDDRNELRTGDRVALVIANQLQLARDLVDNFRQRGIKVLVALGAGDGLSLARAYRPDAIALDLDAPMVDGWTFFQRLKHDGRTRHVPIVLLAGPSVERADARCRGAFSLVQKPLEEAELDRALDRLVGFLDRPRRQLLLVEADESERRAIESLLEGDDVEVTTATTATECLSLLSQLSFDCLVLDPALPDLTGRGLLEALEAHPAVGDTPILLYGAGGNGRAATWTESRLAIKQVHAVEDLFSEAGLLLHRRQEQSRGAPSQELLHALPEIDPILVGNKVLVVDDDVRNIFALTSMLERHGAMVMHAENGRRAIEVLKDHPDTDVVLMDIMMPEMDGYQTTRQIRTLPGFESLPIIALTAKAMKGDREKCLEAGASDYIAKPVEVDQLLGLLRNWLYRTGGEAPAASPSAASADETSLPH
jgi:signal transduction histidine kinase/CheY-like chemotaxis protein